MRYWAFTIICCFLNSEAKAADYFPIQEGNIWIYESRFINIPPSPDTLVVFVEQIPDKDPLSFIVKQQRRQIDLKPSTKWGERLRFDDEGNIWDDNRNYLIFDFSNGNAPNGFDARFFDEVDFSLLEYEATSIALHDNPPPDVDPNADEGSDLYIFTDGLGLVQQVSDLYICGCSIVSNLIWAKVNDKEFGIHPGLPYPTNSDDIYTAIRTETWGNLKYLRLLNLHSQYQQK